MRFTLTLVLATLMVALSVPAFAELQNVEVGGSIRIRGNWYSSEAVGQARHATRIFPPTLPGAFQFEESGNAADFVEQRSTISVKADFTNDVTAFIELDSYEVWGTSFRDSYLFAANADAADGTNNVDIYQGYIETRETFGYPVTARIGRQEIVLGTEWLMGNNDTSSIFTGLSYDGITLNYAAETWNVTAIWAKVVETGAAEEDGDTDLYGIHGSYTGVEDWTFDAYWLMLRDAAAPVLSTPVNALNFDLLEDLFGVDQYDNVQKIHTFGLRGNGTYGGFDFEGEIAYQVGDATQVVSTFLNPDGNSLLGNGFGDDDAEYDVFGANAEIGYTFDVNYQPRVYIGGAIFEGEDNREDTFGDFIESIINPFADDDASISFNRLFSDWEYSEFLENTDLSNAVILRAGVSAQVTEKIDVLLALAHFSVDEATTTNGFWAGIPLAALPFLGDEHDDDLGWELGLYLTYAYSEDLSVKAGYAHYFSDSGVSNNNGWLGWLAPVVGGNFIGNNGQARVGGFNDDDADYLFVETSIKF